MPPKRTAIGPFKLFGHWLALMLAQLLDRLSLSKSDAPIHPFGNGGMMNSFTVGAVAFVFMFGGAMAGMFLNTGLPNDHLRDDSRDVVKLAGGLIGTLAALVLGLLIASGKGYYDAQSTELTHMSADIVVLDQCLAHYGPETASVRDSLRKTVTGVLEQSWAAHHSVIASLNLASRADALYDQIQALEPKNDAQRALQSQSLAMTVSLGRTRWLLYEQASLSVSKPLLVVMVFWLMVTFAIWGVLAPANKTLVVTMCIAALSAAGAIYLMLEMYEPYQGLIQVSDAPLKAALAQLGR
jgi:hypothetical protein